MMTTEPKKKLVLHIEVPDVWADDLDDLAGYMRDVNESDAAARLDVVLNEWFRPDCGLTLVSIPGDKCMNHEFQVLAYQCRIVGAEARGTS